MAIRQDTRLEGLSLLTSPENTVNISREQVEDGRHVWLASWKEALLDRFLLPETWMMPFSLTPAWMNEAFSRGLVRSLNILFVEAVR